MSQRPLPIISLFSGALGLDLGLERAGFMVRVAVESNKHAVNTIRRNRPDIHVIDRRIEDVTTDEILHAAKLKSGEPVVVTGGPSCQTFSTVGRRGSLSDPRGVLFKEFLRVVKEARPEFFVMENVRGVLSAAIKHRPLRERGPGFPPLQPDEELGSAFQHILNELQATGYYAIFDLLNAADYGVPQMRERVIFIGSRDGKPLVIPASTHSPQPCGNRVAYITLSEALSSLTDPKPLYNQLSNTKRRFLELVPAGGNWRDLPIKLQKEALGGAYNSWGGRSGFCRRLSWDKPAPAVTTSPDSKATMMCHPDELRPLSVRECARLQQFPDTWAFSGSTQQQYMQVGNAVPLGLGEIVGQVITVARKHRARKAFLRRLGTVDCHNEDLLKRLAKRPRTILNPVRMRKVKDATATEDWHSGHSRSRGVILTNTLHQQPAESQRSPHT